MKAWKVLLASVTIKYGADKKKKEFEFAVFKINASRLNSAKESLAKLSSSISGLLQWKDPFKSTYALLTYCLVVWYLEVWMIPLLPILTMTVYMLKPQYRKLDNMDEEEKKCGDCDDDILEHKGHMTEEENWTFAEKIKELMQKAFWIQEMMGNA